MYYAGLDVGTTGSKITVFCDHNYLDKFYHSYPAKHEEGTHEIDMEIVLKTVFELIKEAHEKYPSLEAIGISSFGETAVLLDKDDHPLFPSLLYTDPRGEEEGRWLEEKIGKELLGSITGQRGIGMFSLPKILYFKNHEPDKFKLVKKILLVEDYIVYSLTGVRQIDYSLASRTLAFDVKNRVWSRLILEAAGIDESLFSKPVQVGTLAGVIKQEIKEQLHLDNDIKIISIAHDQIANAIGGGVFNKGDAIDGCGTCECLTVLFDDHYNDAILCDCGYGIIPYLQDKQNVCYALINTGGSLIEWVINNFFADLLPFKNLHSLLEEKVKDKPTSVMILPHFAGASTPYVDKNALGGIVNLDLASTRYEIYQATLESLCYEMRYSMDTLKQAGVDIKRIYASGGGSQNATWMQMKADVFNVPILKMALGDVGALGSAAIVGTVLKVFTSIEEGVKALTKVEKVFYPNANKHELYNEQYQKYLHLYEALKEVR